MESFDLEENEIFQSLDPRLIQLIQETSEVINESKLELLSSVTAFDVNKMFDKIQKGFSKSSALKILLRQLEQTDMKKRGLIEMKQRFLKMRDQKMQIMQKQSELIDPKIELMSGILKKIEESLSTVSEVQEKNSLKVKIVLLHRLKEDNSKFVQQQQFCKKNLEMLVSQQNDERKMRIYSKREDKDWSNLGILYDSLKAKLEDFDKLIGSGFEGEMNISLSRKEKKSGTGFFSKLKGLDDIFQFTSRQTIVCHENFGKYEREVEELNDLTMLDMDEEEDEEDVDEVLQQVMVMLSGQIEKRKKLNLTIFKKVQKLENAFFKAWGSTFEILEEGESSPRIESLKKQKLVAFYKSQKIKKETELCIHELRNEDDKSRNNTLILNIFLQMVKYKEFFSDRMAKINEVCEEKEIMMEDKTEVFYEERNRKLKREIEVHRNMYQNIEDNVRKILMVLEHSLAYLKEMSVKKNHIKASIMKKYETQVAKDIVSLKENLGGDYPDEINDSSDEDDKILSHMKEEFTGEDGESENTSEKIRPKIKVDMTNDGKVVKYIDDYMETPGGPSEEEKEEKTNKLNSKFEEVDNFLVKNLKGKLQECETQIHSYFEKVRVNKRALRNVFKELLENTKEIQISERIKRIDSYNDFCNKIYHLVKSLSDVTDQSKMDAKYHMGLLKIIESIGDDEDLERHIKYFCDDKRDLIMKRVVLIEQFYQSVKKLKKFCVYLDERVFLVLMQKKEIDGTTGNMMKRISENMQEFEKLAAVVKKVLSYNSIRLTLLEENYDEEFKKLRESEQYFYDNFQELEKEKEEIRLKLEFNGKLIAKKWYKEEGKKFLIQEKNRHEFKIEEFNELDELFGESRKKISNLKYLILKILLRVDEEAHALKKKYERSLKEFDSFMEDAVREIKKNVKNNKVIIDENQVRNFKEKDFNDNYLKKCVKYVKSINKFIKTIGDVNEVLSLRSKKNYFLEQIIESDQKMYLDQVRSGEINLTEFVETVKIAEHRIVNQFEEIHSLIVKDSLTFSLFKKLESDIYMEVKQIDFENKKKILKIEDCKKVLDAKNSLEKYKLLAKCQIQHYKKQVALEKFTVSQLENLLYESKRERRKFDQTPTEIEKKLNLLKRKFLYYQKELNKGISKDMKMLTTKVNEIKFHKAFEFMKEEIWDLDINEQVFKSLEYFKRGFIVTKPQVKKNILKKKQQMVCVPDFFLRKVFFKTKKGKDLFSIHPEGLISIEKVEDKPKVINLLYFDMETNDSPQIVLLCENNRERELLYSLLCSIRPGYHWSKILSKKNSKRTVTTISGTYTPKRVVKKNYFSLGSKTSNKMGTVGTNVELSGKFEAKCVNHPMEELILWTGVWNMQGIKPPTQLSEIVSFLPLNAGYDMYVVGIHESFFKKTVTLRSYFTNLINELNPESSEYLVLRTENAYDIQIVVIVSIKAISRISCVDSSKVVVESVKCGCCGIRFKYNESKLCFLNSSLPSSINSTEREKVYRKYFELQLGNSELDINNQNDYIFWLGDFQSALFNIESAFEAEDVDLDKLVESDELKKEMNRTKFVGYEEEKIQFLPTYPIDPESKILDVNASDLSYRLRILRRSRKEESVECIKYESATDFCFGNHFPVFGIFTIKTLRQFNVLGSLVDDNLSIIFTKIKFNISTGIVLNDPRVFFYSPITDKFFYQVDPKKKPTKSLEWFQKDLPKMKIGVGKEYLQYYKVIICLREGKERVDNSNLICTSLLELEPVFLNYERRGGHKFVINLISRVGAELMGKLEGEVYISGN